VPVCSREFQQPFSFLAKFWDLAKRNFKMGEKYVFVLFSSSHISTVLFFEKLSDFSIGI
jgi:hypothetical protein